LGIQHCGYCLPCLIRRGAILRGFGPGGDSTKYTIDDLTARALDTLQSEGVQIRSFQLAIERLSARPTLAPSRRLAKPRSLAYIAVVSRKWPRCWPE
jgi:hypothetical protein